MCFLLSHASLLSQGSEGSGRRQRPRPPATSAIERTNKVLRIVGKGNKKRLAPLPQPVLDALDESVMWAWGGSLLCSAQGTPPAPAGAAMVRQDGGGGATTRSNTAPRPARTGRTAQPWYRLQWQAPAGRPNLAAGNG